MCGRLNARNNCMKRTENLLKTTCWKRPVDTKVHTASPQNLLIYLALVWTFWQISYIVEIAVEIPCWYCFGNWLQANRRYVNCLTLSETHFEQTTINESLFQKKRTGHKYRFNLEPFVSLKSDTAVAYWRPSYLK